MNYVEYVANTYHRPIIGLYDYRSNAVNTTSEALRQLLHNSWINKNK